jgi:hypothetical protein
VTSDELLARWRQAEQAVSQLSRGTPAWKVARRNADQAWQEYERQLHGGLAARRREPGQ